jgi:hypothetical protein
VSNNRKEVYHTEQLKDTETAAEGDKWLEIVLRDPGKDNLQVFPEAALFSFALERLLLSGAFGDPGVDFPVAFDVVRGLLCGGHFVPCFAHIKSIAPFSGRSQEVRGDFSPRG